MTAGSEPRQKRLKLALPVYVTEHPVDGSPEKLSEGKLRDLSVGGCAFFHHEEIPVGTRLHVKINLNEQLAAKFNKQQLTAKGAVVRTVHEKDEFLISVRFTH